MMPSRTVEVVLAALLAILVAAAGDRPALAANGNRFTLNGNARFLVFVSYFDGIRRIPDTLESTAVLDADLEYFTQHGISGVRVFPNWQFRVETLMDCSGGLRRRQLEKLLKFLDRAAARQMVVDLSFTIDTVKNAAGRQCLGAPSYKAALETATNALANQRNVLFDLQNEHDKNHPLPDESRRWTPSEWSNYLGVDILPSIKRRDASRLVTVSWTSDADAASVVADVRTHGYDVISYHYRGSAWESNTGALLKTLKSLAAHAQIDRPIYLQEPNRFPFDTNVAHYERALSNAVRSGAAAWTFHNSVVSKPLNGATPFEELLEPGERTFVNRIPSLVSARLE